MIHAMPQSASKWWIRGLAPATVIGVAISLLVRSGRPGFELLPTLGAGIVIGISCHTTVWALQYVFTERLDRFSKPVAWIFRGLLYTVGGSLGFVIGLTLSLLTIWGLPLQVILREVAFGPMLLTASAIALVIGISAYTYSELRARLAKSIERLKEHEFAEKELELARAIQSRLLPPPETQGDGYRVAARNLAARYVAGDFYDVFHLVDGSLGLVVADVSGKGIGASLIMASVKSILPILAADQSVEQTLTQLNSKLVRELGKREFVALAMARFEPASGRLQLANAGLPEPYLLRKGQIPAPISSTGTRLPLGIRASVSYQATQLQLQPGDRFLMLSDGIPEAPTARGEPLGYEELGALLSEDGQPPDASEWLDALLARVRARSSETLEDDWTALLLERTGELSSSAGTTPVRRGGASGSEPLPD
jgi:hypothetical protein